MGVNIPNSNTPTIPVNVPAGTSSMFGSYNSRIYTVKITDANGQITWASATAYYSCLPEFHYDESGPIVMGREVQRISIVPNPAEKTGQFDINFKLDQSDDLVILVHDSYGKTIRQLYKGALQKSDQKITVRDLNLPEGVYTVSVQGKYFN